MTSARFPSIRGGGVHPAVRLRSAGPIEEKLPTMVASRTSSTAVATTPPAWGRSRTVGGPPSVGSQPPHALVADPVEEQPEERVGQGERAP